MSKKIAIFLLLFSSLMLIKAQDQDSGSEPSESAAQPSSSTEPFKPSYIIMGPRAVTFEEGRFMTITDEEAEEAINAAYDYVKTFNPDNTTSSARFNEDRQTILSLRANSIAQLFAKTLGEKRYVYINVFPYNGTTQSAPVRHTEYRHQGGGAAYWKIRYDLDNKTCFGFSANRPL